MRSTCLTRRAFVDGSIWLRISSKCSIRSARLGTATLLCAGERTLDASEQLGVGEFGHETGQREFHVPRDADHVDRSLIVELDSVQDELSLGRRERSDALQQRDVASNLRLAYPD